MSAETKTKVLKMMIFVLDRVENIVGKGESAGYTLFPIGFLPRVVYCVGKS